MNFAPVQQIPVGPEIVHDLGRQTADVDGVGAGEPEGQLPVPALGEDVLHAGLGIVKIALHGAHGHIFALLGHHLGPLHLADAAVGVEHADADAGNVPEAHQGGLAGVAGGGGEDQDILLHALGRLCRGEQLGEHGKGHILEGGGGATEQLQHAEIADLHGGGQILGLEFPGVGSGNQSTHIGNFRQQGGENVCGHFLAGAVQTGLPVKFGERFGHIQTAVGCQTLQDGLGTVDEVSGVSGGMIQHGKLLCLFIKPVAQKTGGKRRNPLLFVAIEIR